MTLTLLLNYITISLRYLARNKTFAIVNILGLSLGVAAVLLIYQYVVFEKSYDEFHKHAANLYRVTTEWNPSVTPHDKRATTVPWSGPGVKDALPEVVNYTRFAPLAPITGNNSVQYEDTKFEETGIYMVDPGFLTMFSFELLEGNARTALNGPHQIIMTQRVADKYFGQTSPLGKTIVINGHGNLSGDAYEVVGVMANPPANSHMHFDFLVSYSSMWEGLANGSTYWHWDNTYCYLLIRPGTNINELEQKISALRIKLFANEMTYFDDVIHFKLQPVRDIHLNSALQNEIAINGDGRSIRFLTFIGLFILLSAYVNYINLATVKAIGRRTEIGIRKVVGSTRIQLSVQVMVEALIVNLFALALGIAVAMSSVPVLEHYLASQWPPIEPHTFTKGSFLIGAVAVLLGGVLLSGLYPAFVLSSFRPAQVLKGNIPSRIPGNRWSLQKCLVVMQFAFCIAFTTGTYLLFQQLKFMREHDLGMNMDQVVAVRCYGFQSYQSYLDFKNKLSSSALIASIGSSSAAPGDEITMQGLKPKVRIGDSPTEVEVKWVSVDQDFFKTLGVEMLAGRNFVNGSPTEKDAVILNEAAAQALGYDPHQVVQQPVYNLKQQACTIVGVIRNYHQRSLRSAYEPIVFVPNWFNENDFGWNKLYYYVKLSPTGDGHSVRRAITEIESAWNTTVSDHPFSYFFLDTHFESQYKSEQVFSTLFMYFTGFSIFISSLGLFGLVAYTTLQRTKEIGIRKVLGATVNNILLLLSADFIRLIAAATVVVLPFVIMLSGLWLEEYTFRITLSAELFITPVAIIFLISLVTVVFKSLKVAVANPVDSIRYE